MNPSKNKREADRGCNHRESRPHPAEIHSPFSPGFRRQIPDRLFHNVYILHHIEHEKRNRRRDQDIIKHETDASDRAFNRAYKKRFCLLNHFVHPMVHAVRPMIRVIMQMPQHAVVVFGKTGNALRQILQLFN